MPVATFEDMPKQTATVPSSERKKRKKQVIESADVQDQPLDKATKKSKRKSELTHDSPELDKKKKRKKKNLHVEAEDIEIAGNEAPEDSSNEAMEEDEESDNGDNNKVVRHVIPLNFIPKMFRNNIMIPDKVAAELVMFSEILERGDSKRDVAKEYFEAGGSCSEILEAMAQCRKSDASKCISAIFILGKLFLRCLRDFPEQLTDCEECALSLLQSAAPFINNLLAPSQSYRRVNAAIKLLTAMVSLSTRIAREVLKVVSLGKDEVRRLTSRDNDRMHLGVRTCFLHFLLAFLVEGDLEKIQLLLVKEGVLSSALRGLLFDDAELVHLVLTTVQTNVVENSGVSKRVKQHVFNTRVLESLVLLYEWQGPSQVNRQRRKQQFKTNSVTNMVDQEGLELVQQSVHDFLSLLLTSHKLGVIFTTQAIDTPTSKHNYMAFTALRRLHRPWDNPLKGDLVINVLKACPTLVKPTLTVHTEALAPRPTPAWHRILDYFIKVLSSVDMSDAVRGSHETSTPRHMATLAESLCLPVSLLQATLMPGLTHSHPAVKEGCARLLACIFDRLTSHVNYIVQEKLLSNAGVVELQQLLATRLAQLVPGVNIVWDAWELVVQEAPKPEVPAKQPDDSSAINLDEDSASKADGKDSAPNIKDKDSAPKRQDKDSAPETKDEDSAPKTKDKDGASKLKDKDDEGKKEDKSSGSDSEEKEEEKKKKIKRIEAKAIITTELHAPHEVNAPLVLELPTPPRSRQLASLLALLLGYQRWLPHWVEGGRGATKGSALLEHVRTAAMTLDSEEGSKLQVQAVKLLASFDSLSIMTNQDSFQWAVTLLVNECEKDVSAYIALRRLLNRLHLLQDNAQELDIWLWSLQVGGEMGHTVLADALVILARNTLKYQERIYEVLSEKQYEGVTSQGDQLDQLLQEMTSECEEGVVTEIIDRCPHAMAFSPLILAALDTAGTDRETQRVLGAVLVRLLHYQTHPAPLTSLIKYHLKRVAPTATKYLQGWVDGGHPSLPGGLLSEMEKSVDKFICGTQEELPDLTACEETLLRQLFVHTVFQVNMAITQFTLDQKLQSRAQQILLHIVAVSTSDLSQELLYFILSHPTLLAQFSLSSKSECNRLTTSLLLSLASLATQRRALAAIRHKTLQQLKKSLDEQANTIMLSWCEAGALSHLLTSLLLDRTEVGLVLDKTTKLSYTTWLTNDQSSLSQPGDVAVCMLDRLICLRKESCSEGVSATLVLETEQLTELSKVLCQLVAIPVDVTPLENSIAQYLELYPHQLEYLPKGLLSLLLAREWTPGKLATLLVSRDVTLTKVLQKWAIKASPEYALPLLWTSHCSFQSTIEQDTWKQVWAKVQSPSSQAMKKPASIPSWLITNLDAALFLVQHFLDPEEAQSLISRVKKLGLIATNVAHCRLVTSAWSKLGKNQAALTCWLLKSLVQALQSDDSSDVASILCTQALAYLKTPNLDLTPLGSSNCLDVVTSCLRHGVGGNSDLMQVLADTLKCIPAGELHVHTWEMLLGHSQFLPAMLGKNQQNIVGVLSVIDAITAMAPQVMNSSHIPVLLGTYQASLSASDQIIISLLHRYESHGVNLQEFRPLVWGEAAISRYALRSKSGNTSLWHEPSTGQALKLLDQGRVNATLARFPLNRGLNDDTTAPVDNEVYDPSFVLPLLCQLLAPESLVQPWLVTRQALGLCLMSLCSQRDDTRQAAQLAIARLYFHLEAGRLTVEKKLWLRFLDTLRGSVSSLDKDTALPTVLGLFLARASQVISQPEHALYAPLNKFLLAQPAVDTSAVPELLRLLHSSEHEHRAHRLWILSVLKDGTKTATDFALFNSSFAFKLLACLYNSNLADTKIKASKNHIVNHLNKNLKICVIFFN